METYNYCKDGKLKKVDVGYLKRKGIKRLDGIISITEDKNTIHCLYVDGEDIYCKKNSDLLFI